MDTCCKECFVPSHDVNRGHVQVAVPESCGDEECICHGWEIRFKELEGMVRNITRAILYTDTIRGEQTLRDDLWAISSTELNELKKLLRNEIIMAQVQVLTDAKDAVRKCKSPDRKEEKNKLFEASLIQRIDAMDAIDEMRSRINAMKSESRTIPKRDI